MTPAALRRHRLTRTAAALTAVVLLAPHLLKGDGLWFLAVLAVGAWVAVQLCRAVRASR